ncbi:MAG TPA: toxin-antitoxin system HicB family antitoxin [Candidatus Fermentibacter daniensis]|nr:toxin-antitoxin system HicB family antitoxin [Candidatus Fermentibacter daniensis]
MSSHGETDHLDMETLPCYPITLVPCEDGGFVAKISDLQGCIAQGDSAEEALAALEEVKSLWIESAMEHGDEIPAPSSDRDYSGRLLVRMPKRLHRELSEAALDAGCSLNQYIVYLLGQRIALHQVKNSLDEVHAFITASGVTADLWRIKSNYPESR